jgi:hypothetical protein
MLEQTILFSLENQNKIGLSYWNRIEKQQQHGDDHV